MRDPKPKRQKLTDAERHARFVAMAKEVEASENANDFDDAFMKVVGSPTPQSSSRSQGLLRPLKPKKSVDEI